jgi:hypothetical protein
VKSISLDSPIDWNDQRARLIMGKQLHASRFDFLQTVSTITNAAVRVTS